MGRVWGTYFLLTIPFEFLPCVRFTYSKILQDNLFRKRKLNREQYIIWSERGALYCQDDLKQVISPLSLSVCFFGEMKLQYNIVQRTLEVLDIRLLISNKMFPCVSLGIKHGKTQLSPHQGIIQTRTESHILG